MRLTTKGRFAVNALLDIAIHSKDGAVSLQSVSERQQISLSYLEQIFRALRKHKLVSSQKGPGGGYYVSNLDVNIYQIVASVNDSVDARACKGLTNCKNTGQCLSHNLWNDVTGVVSKYLQSVKLSDLVNKTNKVEINFTSTIKGLK